MGGFGKEKVHPAIMCKHRDGTNTSKKWIQASSSVMVLFQLHILFI